MAVENLFDPVVVRALPLSHGADLRFDVSDDSMGAPTPWPAGTKGILEIDNQGEIITINATLVNGKLEFVIYNNMVDNVPATTPSNKVSWRLRVALASDPTVELPVYEGPVYRGRHG